MTPVSPLRALPRWFSKLLIFLLKERSFSKALLLADHDGPIRTSFKGVSTSELRSALIAVRSWADLLVTDSDIRSLRLDIPFQGNDLISRCHDELVHIKESGLIISRMDLGLRVENAGCRFSLQTEEEVYIVHEVFVDRCYALQLRGKWQLIDVGANVGISSLMFASQPWVSRIWAFEPFPPTVASFIANMALNPDLANKICLQPFGLCGTDAFIDVNYAPDLKGSMSIHGLGHWRGKSQEPKEKVRIEVKNASRALSQCVQLAPGEKLCAKIDCEGSEYEILDDLEASGWLKNIDVIIMEWHDRQPEGLIGQLQRCGYYVHARSLNPTHAFGLMLAWRPSSVGPDVVPLQRPNSC